MRAAIVLVFIAIILSARSVAQYELESALSEAVPCGTREMQSRLKVIMYSALDKALEEHIKHTYEVWMKDETDQPKRASVGVRKGLNAYVQSRGTIDKWQLMECPSIIQP